MSTLEPQTLPSVSIVLIKSFGITFIHSLVRVEYNLTVRAVYVEVYSFLALDSFVLIALDLFVQGTGFIICVNFKRVVLADKCME